MLGSVASRTAVNPDGMSGTLLPMVVVATGPGVPLSDTYLDARDEMGVGNYLVLRFKKGDNTATPHQLKELSAKKAWPVSRVLMGL